MSARRLLTKHAGAYPDLFVRLGEQVLSVSLNLYDLCCCSQVNFFDLRVCVHVCAGLPKQDSGHWWSSFFFGKQPGMSPLTEEK